MQSQKIAVTIGRSHKDELRETSDERVYVLWSLGHNDVQAEQKSNKMCKIIGDSYTRSMLHIIGRALLGEYYCYCFPCSDPKAVSLHSM